MVHQRRYFGPEAVFSKIWSEGQGRGKTASFLSRWVSKHVISVELGLQTLKSHRVGLQGCRWSYCLAAIMDQFIYEN